MKVCLVSAFLDSVGDYLVVDWQPTSRQHAKLEEFKGITEDAHEVIDKLVGVGEDILMNVDKACGFWQACNDRDAFFIPAVERRTPDQITWRNSRLVEFLSW